MIAAVAFDWGDTVMRDFRACEGPMASWPLVEAVAGAEEVLRTLHPRHRLVLATNAAESDSALVRRALARVGLDVFFERVFVSSELGVEKPDPRFFAAVLAGLALASEQVVMVGDSYVNDVCGAHAAGMRTVWLTVPDAEPPGVQPPAARAAHDARIATLTELPAALARFADPDWAASAARRTARCHPCVGRPPGLGCLYHGRHRGGHMNLALQETWSAHAIELGADDAMIIPPATVVTADWVRMKCLFGCDGPGAYRCCPPNAPPVEDTRRLLDSYQRAVLLSVGPFRGYDDSDDHGRRLNDAATDLERALFLTGFHKAWAMGAGPCDRCDPCLMDEPCKIPERARPSMEGCGVDVFTTVRNAGRQIEVVKDKDDEYRFFALVLVD